MVNTKTGVVLLECLEGGVFCLGVHRDFAEGFPVAPDVFHCSMGDHKHSSGAAGQSLQLENKLGAGFMQRFQAPVSVTLSPSWGSSRFSSPSGLS